MSSIPCSLFDHPMVKNNQSFYLLGQVITIAENWLWLNAFQLPRVIMWGLSLYCCVSHRCCTAEQRLMTTLTITTSAAMSLLRAFVMVQVTIWLSITYPQCHISASQFVRISQLLIVSPSHLITKSLPLSLTTLSMTTLQCSEDA